MQINNENNDTVICIKIHKKLVEDVCKMSVSVIYLPLYDTKQNCNVEKKH